MNQADSVIFQTENQLKDLGDKIPADQKASIEGALNKLRDAHKAQDIPAVDSAMDELTKLMQELSQNIYNQQQAGANPGQDAGGNTGSQSNGGDNNVTDVDFEEVK